VAGAASSNRKAVRGISELVRASGSAVFASGKPGIRFHINKLTAHGGRGDAATEHRGDGGAARDGHGRALEEHGGRARRESIGSRVLALRRGEAGST